MTDAPDLRTALAGIANGAALAHTARAEHAENAAAGDLPVAAMRAAARRRRTRFEVGVSVAGAAAVAAVLLAGSTVIDAVDRGAAPPAVGPTLRTDDGWFVDYSECATRGPQDRGTVPLLLPAIADSGAFTTVAALLEGGGSDQWTLARNLDVAALDADGVVVGVSGLPADNPGFEATTNRSATDGGIVQSAPLFSCALKDGVTRLAPGRYALSVGLRVLTPTGSGAVDGWTYQTTEVVVPPPAASLAGSLPIMRVEPARTIECGDTFPPSTPGEPDDVQVRLHSLVGSVEEQGVPNAITMGLELVDTGAPGGPSRAMGGGTPDAYLVRDGVVVDVALDHVQGNWYDDRLALAPGSTWAFDRLFQGECGVRLPAEASYEVWTHLTLDDEAFVAGPWVLGSIGWAPVDAADLPDVPLVDGRVLRTEANEDGARWRVTVALDVADSRGYEQAYENAIEALTDAGFAVASEDTDPARPAWRYAELFNDELHVTLDASNETGEGYYADYVISAQG